MTSKSRDSRGKVTYMSFGSGENLISKSCGLWEKKTCGLWERKSPKFIYFCQFTGAIFNTIFFIAEKQCI